MQERNFDFVLIIKHNRITKRTVGSKYITKKIFFIRNIYCIFFFFFFTNAARTLGKYKVRESIYKRKFYLTYLLKKEVSVLVEILLFAFYKHNIAYITPCGMQVSKLFYYMRRTYGDIIRDMIPLENC